MSRSVSDERLSRRGSSPTEFKTAQTMRAPLQSMMRHSTHSSTSHMQHSVRFVDQLSEDEIKMRHSSSKSTTATKTREENPGVEAFPLPVPQINAEGTSSSPSLLGEQAQRQAKIGKRLRRYMHFVWARPWFQSRVQRDRLVQRGAELPSTVEEQHSRHSDVTVHR